MECSKCRLVKDRSSFYAAGKVCKDCKRNYARKYRSSKTGDTQSRATTDDASVRSMDDVSYAAEDTIMERLRKVETDVEESREKVCGEIAFLRAGMHQATSAILERLLKIDESLDKMRRHERSVRITSHPLADFA